MQAGKAARVRTPHDPVIEAYKKDVDRTLLIESLKLTVEERIDRLEGFVREIETLRAGVRQ
jgi:hypothetical protein